MPSGLKATGQLLIAEEDGEEKARLFLICNDARVLLLSKTIIAENEDYKPHEGSPLKIDVTLLAGGRDKVKIANASWHFVNGLDIVVTPELSEPSARFLELLIRQGGRFSMNHSETAIFLHPVATVAAITTFSEDCQSAEVPQ